MEKVIQRGETQEIPRRTDPGGLRQDTYPKAVKLTTGLQTQLLLKMGGRRIECHGYFSYKLLPLIMPYFCQKNAIIEAVSGLIGCIAIRIPI